MSPWEDSQPRGFTYEPLDAADALDDKPVTYLELRHDEYAGPFWNHDEGLSEDYEDWKPYGMTRATFDACVSWNSEPGDAQEKARLLSLLRQELTASVEVDSTK